MRNLLRLLMSVAALVLLATVAGAQEPQREAVIQEITIRGTVEAVDHAARILRVKTDQGNIVTVDVPASYTRFDQVRIGDVVSTTYYDRVSVRLKPAGEAPIDRADTTTTTLAPGVLPGGTRVTQRITTVRIDSWDPATRIVTFTNSKGQTYTRRIVETLDPKVLAGLKVGDQVDVTRTEATNLAVVTPAPPAAAAAPQQIIAQGGKSRARGFFLGGSYEGNGVVVEDSEETDSGSGYGITIGYGFTSTLALYGQLNGASVDSAGGSYDVGHFDLGLRVHFLAPAKRFVPFVQGGFSARALRQDIGADEEEYSGAGFAFGGGINIHFIPALAFTTGITWSLGNINNYKLNGTEEPIDSFGVTTARFHIGIIWFPQSK
jgi:hypothetical protein